MKRQIYRSLSAAIIAGLLPIIAVAAKPPVSAADKEAEKLLAEGNDFRSGGKINEAVWAYRQAAKAGNLKAACAAGELLCGPLNTSRGQQRILDVSEGLSDLFVAATNRLPQACDALSGLLQHGTLVESNLVAAYAWMKIAADQDRAFKKQLDQLAAQIPSDELPEATALANRYAKGHWPANLFRPVDRDDPRLKIKGITKGGRMLMVVLNRVTFTEGDTLNVAPDSASRSALNGKLTVTCMEIGPDYVLVSIAGESHLKLLSATKLLE